MKILLLTDGIYPFQMGGMQKHSAVLLRLLATHGIKVQVLHPGGSGYSQQAFNDLLSPEIQGLISSQVISFPSGDRLPGHYLRENKAYSKRCFHAVEKTLADVDLVYAQGFTGWHFLKMKRKGFAVPPVLVNFHGYGEFQKPPGWKVGLQYAMLRPAMRFNIKNADYVYSFGGKIDAIIRKTGVPENRILAQVNGIEENWLVNKVNDKPVSSFVFIGRPEERKGIREINGAIQQLPEDSAINFNFHFVGPFEEHMKVNHPNLVYHGAVASPERIREILDGCDCLVCPSYAEGMPTVVLEAMARGLVIIGTDVGAISRQIDGNGILLDRPDATQLAIAMRTMMEKDPSEIRRMREKSLGLVRERFLWSKVIAAKIRDFNQILSGPPGKR